jgi:hypothetical protein
VNAARNILAAGLAVSACGAGVRPQRGKLRPGQQAVKEETRWATAGIPVLQRGGCQTGQLPQGTFFPSRLEFTDYLRWARGPAADAGEPEVLEFAGR